jgi:hypothetical protein
MNKKKEYMKVKINEHETNSKNKNIIDLYRSISDFKNDYLPRTNTVKNEKGDLVTDSHSILARWRKHFSQLWNVHGVSDIRQTEIHTAEPLEPERNVFEVKMPIEKLKRHKSPGSDQIPSELIKAGGKTVCSEIHTLILFITRRNFLKGGNSRS